MPQDNNLSVQLNQATEQVAKLSAENTKLSQDIKERDERISALEKQIEDERVQARLSQLKEIGVEDERAAKLSKADADTYDAIVEQIKLTNKQSAALSADYSAGSDAEPRENLLLKAIKGGE